MDIIVTGSWIDWPPPRGNIKRRGTALLPTRAPSLCDPYELEMTNLRPSPLDIRIDGAPAMLEAVVDLHKQTMVIECHKYA